MRIVIFLSVAFGLAAAVPRPAAPASPTFAEDVAFLQRHAPVRLLVAPSGARVAVSAPYQGRVMTSAVAGKMTRYVWF